VTQRRHYWKVRKEDQISFQFDYYINYRSLADILDLDENIPQLDTKICDFITHQSEQNILLLNQVVYSHPLVQKNQGISILISKVEDSFCWGLNNSVGFSESLPHGYPMEFITMRYPNGPSTGFGKSIPCPRSKFSYDNFATKLYHLGVPF